MPILRRALIPFALVLVVSLAPARDASALWQPGGIPIAPASSGLAPCIGVDGTGGIFVLWNPVDPSGPAKDLRVLRRLADGSLAPGWADSGRKIATYYQPGVLTEYIGGAVAVMPDGAGGAFVHFQRDYRSAPGAELLHMNAAGAVLPGWPVELTNSQGSAPTICIEDGGGVLYSLSTYNRFGMPTYLVLGRLRANGSKAVEIATQYPTGTPVPSIATDHSGGAFAGWPCLYGDLDSTLAYSAWGQVAVPSCGSNVRLLSDGGHGFYLAWLSGTTIRVTRFDANGDLVPGWNPNGTVAGTGSATSNIGLLADGTGGLFVTWPAVNDVRVQRMTGAGAIVAGWAAAGAVVSPAPNVSSPSEFVPDGTGGVYVAWSQSAQSGLGSGIFAQHLTASGVPAAGWLPTGNPIHYPDGAGPVVAVGDNAGGVYFCWSGVLNGEYRPFGQHVLAGDNIPLAAPLPRAGALSLAPLANPTSSTLRFSLVLPEAGDARLEAFDMAGRRVAQRSLLAATAGAHDETLRLTGTAPGVYLVRLTQSRHAVSARVVVTR